MNFPFSPCTGFLPQVVQMPLLLYRLLFPFAFLLALPFYALRLLRRERGRRTQEKPAGYKVGLGERFGSYSAELKARLADGPAPIWLCSISVGETLLALKLARALRATEPGVRVVLSVTTTTGYELLLREAAKAPWLIAIYNPVDFRFAAGAALRALKPRALVLIEGGIWPNFLSIARKQGVPVVLASARLSPRSERRWRKRAWFGKAVWNLFDLVCVPEPGDVARFAGIGAPAERVRHTGNIKFDNAATDVASREAEFRGIAASLGFAGEILVAGSTWAPEEKALATALVELRKDWPALRLVIVPRHVERAAEIVRDLAPLRVALRSKLAGTADCDALLVDTTGELRDWYRLATVVFVGKTLPGVVEIGGQNMGEPASLGLPVVYGPHTENFTALVAHLGANDAAVAITSAEELVPALRGLLADPARRAAMGERAREAVIPHQGAAERTAGMIFEVARSGM